MPVDIVSTTKEKVKLVTKLDGAVAGPLVWSIVSGNATLDVAPDSLSAYALSPDVADVSVYKVVAPLNAEGTRTLEDGGTYTVNLADATTIGLSSESAVPK